MLTVDHLTKYYGSNKGIKDVSFSLLPGEIMGVLGHNGSGKTTLFRVLLSLIQPSSGSFRISGHKRITQNLFGYIPEERSMYMDITVSEQIIYLARLRKMKKKDIETGLFRWLSFFSLQAHKDRPIKELSKGNQQKVQFICAVIHNPEIIILDEPLNGLDGVNIVQLKKAINLLSSLGKIILMSSHQYEELEEFCHQVLLLKSGDVLLQGKLSELKKQDPRRYVTINHDSALSYKQEEGVVTSEKMGQYSRYTFNCERQAQMLVNECMSNPVISYLRLEDVSLRDIVVEATR